MLHPTEYRELHWIVVFRHLHLNDALSLTEFTDGWFRTLQEHEKLGGRLWETGFLNADLSVGLGIG